MYIGENYPSVDSMTFANVETVIPSILKRFPSCLITNKDQSTKFAAIGHSIMQATFPRTLIIPLQIGLAIHYMIILLSNINLDFVNHTKKCRVMKGVQL